MDTGQEVESRSEVHSLHSLGTSLASKRNLLFVLLFVGSLVAFLTPLVHLASLALQNVEYNHILLIPFVSLTLLYLGRQRIFADAGYSWGLGALLLLLGIVGDWSSTEYSARLAPDSDLFLRILSLVAVWIAAFILCYGIRAFRSGAFPLLFTLLIVPIPGSIMEKPIVLVQHGSAEVASLLFVVTHVPVFREGMRFSLPGLDIEVAIQCSGIHSTLALLIASLLVGYFWLKTGWKRAVLVLFVLPIVCFTNGLRIFTISVLSAYVNPIFLEGNLHRRGGVLFFVLALFLLAGVNKLLVSCPSDS